MQEKIITAGARKYGYWNKLVSLSWLEIFTDLPIIRYTDNISTVYPTKRMILFFVKAII
jgi:hypothetical protein